MRGGHNLQAVVSFHGLLHSRPTSLKEPLKSSSRLTPEEFAKEVDLAPNTYNSSCKVLIENGELDGEVPDWSIVEWQKEMNENNIDWQFHNHYQTPHGFALAPGVWSTAYTEAADRRSTLSMLSLFAEVWPLEKFPQNPVQANACGTKLNQHVCRVSKL